MLTPREFGQKVAFHLFQTGPLTLGYASKLADMPVPAFRQILKQRDIPLYSCDCEDFA
jgi:predicted HTH domain antitoxin